MLATTAAASSLTPRACCIRCCCIRCKPPPGHCVRVLGWGVSVVSIDVPGPDGGTSTNTVEKPYWLAANEWGEEWGEGGFFRIARGSNGVGFAASMGIAAGIPDYKATPTTAATAATATTVAATTLSATAVATAVTTTTTANLSPGELVSKGSALIISADFAEALALFDKSVQIAPSTASQCWQRGIVLYYLAQYTAGAAQFKLDMTANGADVEEVVWRFMCDARKVGLEAARARMLPVGADYRVPMKQILALYAGTGSMADVAAAAAAVADAYSRTSAIAYGHFYGGIFMQLQGRESEAKAMLEAAAAAPSQDYMGKLMVMHASLLKTAVATSTSGTAASTSRTPPSTATTRTPGTGTVAPNLKPRPTTPGSGGSGGGLRNTNTSGNSVPSNLGPDGPATAAEKEQKKHIMVAILGVVGALLVGAGVIAEVVKRHRDNAAARMYSTEFSSQ